MLKKRKCSVCGDTNIIDEVKDYWICQNCENVVSRKKTLIDEHGNKWKKTVHGWIKIKTQTKIKGLKSDG